MKVFIVDDDENSRLVLEAALRVADHDVVCFANGRAAIDALFTQRPDVVVSDILMPEVDGFSLCRFIKSTPQFHSIPLVFYSATYTDAGDREFGLALGAARYIVKPADLDYLVHEIAAVAAGPRTDAEFVPAGDDAQVEDEHTERLLAKLNSKVAELDAERDALKRSEARLRDFAETAADWFWETDENLDIVVSTNYAERLVGRSILQFLDESESIKGYRSGRVDEGMDLRDLLERHQAFADFEIEWPDNSGELRIFQVAAKPIGAGTGDFAGFRGVCRDTTDATSLARQMAHAATHDPLTGLINRSEFNARLQRAWVSHETYGTPYQLCFLDLDQFKVVNDTAGHIAGDAMLNQIAHLLVGRMRSRDTLARLGGDEFGLLLENCPLEKAREIGEYIVQQVTELQFPWEGRMFKTGVSIGIATLGKQCANPTELLAQADVACYDAKENGRNQVVVYGANTPARDTRHDEMFRAAALQDALDQGRFVLCAQPIVPLMEAGAPRHFEVLIRMLGENEELISPGAFIPAAERYGKMAAIERWVVQEALSSCVPQLASIEGGVVSLNLSGQAFADPGFIDFVQAEIRSAAVDPTQLCFEVTETTAINDLSRAAESIKALRDLGVRFALDDFGSGACSFTYLKRLPIDFIKIDGSFVQNILHDQVDHALVRSLGEIARVMQVKTIAEWVESRATADLLRSMSIDFCQGYYFGEPQSVEDLRRGTEQASGGTC